MTTTLLIAATLIVLALAGYAGWLHYLLWRRRQSTAAAKPAVASPVSHYEPPQSGRVELRKSLYVLADALLNDKMTHTEGCLRICALASHLEEIDEFRQQYGVLFVVAEATAHIPILAEWQALSKEDKARFSKERRAVEAKYAEAVVEAVGRVRERYRG